jgi:hypothetical protein
LNRSEDDHGEIEKAEVEEIEKEGETRRPGAQEKGDEENEGKAAGQEGQSQG